MRKYKYLFDSVLDSISSPTQSNCYFHCFLKRGFWQNSVSVFPSQKGSVHSAFWLLLKKSFLLPNVFCKIIADRLEVWDNPPFCFLTISLVILSSNHVRPQPKIPFISTRRNYFNSSSAELKTVWISAQSVLLLNLKASFQRRFWLMWLKEWLQRQVKGIKNINGHLLSCWVVELWAKKVQQLR